MGTTNLGYEERKHIMLNYLEGKNFATTKEMAALTGCSLATVRRDFLSMDAEGLILRAHGGVQAAAPSKAGTLLPSSGPILDGIDAEKDQIAAHAATLVKPNDCIFIGAGRTCMRFAHYIKDIDHLTVVTTCISVVLELIDQPNISLTLLGGDIYTGPNFIETIPSSDDLEHLVGPLFFDKVFVTVDGIELDSGYTIRYRFQIPLYTQLLISSNLFYMMVDSSKFDCHSFVQAFEFNQIRHVITTKKIPALYREHYQKIGVELSMI